VTTTKFSISAASRITGISRPTISRHAKAGKFSFELNEEGHKIIEASELVRVYGDKCNFDREENRGEASETSRSETAAGNGVSNVNAMQDQLIQRYADENEHLKQTLDKALDYQNSVAKLLEDRSSDTKQWQASLEAMSEKIANQTKSQIDTLQQRHDEELLKLKRILHREVNKTWWDKLFEKKRAGTGNRK